MSKKVVFLYLTGIHQLYHTAMTAFELSQMSGDYIVQLITCHLEHTEILNNLKKYYKTNNLEIIQLPYPFRFKYLNFKNKMYPSPYSTLTKAKKYLLDADIVITTSHTIPKLFRKYNILSPKIIYQFHGCGDRKYSFDPEYKYFDYLLTPGKYHKNRLLKEKIVEESKIKVIGYPKLDNPQNIVNIKNEIFNNNNKIFLYTPHWDPKLSSYKLWGRKIIEYFKKSKKYNLIFAPHIQLKHWKYKYNYNIDLDDLKADNIHIDFGSNMSVDSTYTNIADCYIGDVSSQIYEFIAYKPRPCIFLNVNKIKWQDNLDYRFWELGEVIEELDTFDNLSQNIFGINKYENIQIERINEYIDDNKKPSLKAAKVIFDILFN